MVIPPETLFERYARLAQTAQGVSRVGWVDVLQQAIQFDILTRVDIPPHATVLDIGCGLGDLLTGLRAAGFAGRYTGIDLLPRFVQEAERHFVTDPLACFITGDFFEVDLDSHDFVFASGLFDYRRANSYELWEDAINRGVALARRAFAWNGYYLLHPDRTDMWAIDLVTVTDHCRQASPFWQLRTDYADGHYTAFIFKRDYWLTPALQHLIGRLFLNRAMLNALQHNPLALVNEYGVTLQQLSLLNQWIDHRQ